MNERAGRGIPIDEQLHLGGASARDDDAADDARGREDRHVGPQPVPGALVDRHRPEVRRRRTGDDVRGNRAQVRSISQIEQLLEAARAVAKRTLLLQLNLDVGEPAFQLLVLHLHPPQAYVAVPHVADAADAARDAALDLGEQPERHRLEDRHAALRVDLRGNEDDVRQHDRQEQGAGTEADIEDRHGSDGRHEDTTPRRGGAMVFVGSCRHGVLEV